MKPAFLVLCLGAGLLQSARAPAQVLPDSVQALSARVTALNLRSRGVFLAVLDNGQQWEQNEPEGTVGVAVGDTVTIEPGLLGSYFMVDRTGHWSTKVHRLQ